MSLCRFRVEVDEHKDKEERERYYHFQALMGLYQVLVFTAPLETVAFGNFEARYFLLRLVHIAAHIPSAEIDKDVGCEEPLLALDGGRSFYNLDVR